MASIFLSKVRLRFLKWMEAIGTTASNLASNAKLKAAEINLENRRREILTNFSLRAFEMWQKGVKLPDSLSEMLEELSDIENRLSVLRAQKYAKVASPEAGAGAAQAAAPQAEPEEDAAVSCTVADEEGENEEPVACELGDVEPAPEEPEDGESPVSDGEAAAPEEPAEPEENPAPDTSETDRNTPEAE